MIYYIKYGSLQKTAGPQKRGARSNCYCCDRKSRAACAQSFAPWQQATI